MMLELAAEVVVGVFTMFVILAMAGITVEVASRVVANLVAIVLVGKMSLVAALFKVPVGNIAVEVIVVAILVDRMVLEVIAVEVLVKVTVEVVAAVVVMVKVDVVIINSEVVLGSTGKVEDTVLPLTKWADIVVALIFALVEVRLPRVVLGVKVIVRVTVEDAGAWQRIACRLHDEHVGHCWSTI